MGDSVYNINETFIIEEVTNDTPVISACTALYSNDIFSCTGNTFITLGDGIIEFNGDLYTNDNLTANTINATTFISGGTNLFNIIQLVDITGGTYNKNSGILTLTKPNNNFVSISGISDYYTTGATLVGNIAYFNRNDSLSAYTLDLTTLIPPTPFDVYVTGGTYSNGTATFTNNTGGTFTVSGFFTGSTDVRVTGFTYSNNTLKILDNIGNQYNAIIDVMSGLTVNGNLLSTTISATTYQNLPIDVRVTGGTYSNGTTTFINNTGGTFNVSGFFTSSDDKYVSGFTYNAATYDLTVKNTDVDYTVNLGVLASDVTITGGTYNPTTGVATFTNNTGGTFNVSGFITGFTDIYVTGFTYDNANRLTISDSAGNNYSTYINYFSGMTINGNLIVDNTYSNTISATTYQNLPIDVRVTGGTYSNGTAIFTNNTGGTFNVSGFSISTASQFTGGTVSGETIFTNGLSANTFSATTYQNLPTDVRVTGGSYNQSTGITTFTNNTGGTFTVNGYYTGYTPSIDVYVTGSTYSNGTAIFTNNTGGTFSVSGFFTGSTDVYVTGSTYTNNTFTFTNNTGGTFNVLFNTLTGLTVNGVLSATTYQGLPTDVRVTGGTYSNGTATFTNNTGGTFSISGFSTGSTGTDIYVTGGTYSNGTTTLRRNDNNTITITGYTSGQFSVYGTGIDGSATTTTSNTLIGSILIPANTFVAGDVIRMEMRARKSATSHTATNRFYFNTINNLAGATLIGTSTAGATLTATYMARTLPIKVAAGTGAGTEGVFIAGTYNSDLTPLNNVSSLAINWTNDVYLLMAGQMSNSGETQTLSYFTIKKA